MAVTFNKSSTLVAKKYREFLASSLMAALAGQLGIVIDSLMVGNFLGPNAMTGVSVCMPLEQIIGAVAILLSMAAAGMVAVAAGARETDEANRIFSTVIILNALTAAVFLAVLVPFLRETAAFLAGQEAITPLTCEYLRIMVWRTPFRMLLSSLSILINSDGMVKLTGRGTLLAQAVNIGLDLLLIRVCDMGLHGAAIATVASDIAALSYILLIYLSSGERTLRFVGADKGFWRRSWELIRAGFPAAAATGLVSVRVWCIYHILEQAGGAEAMQIYAVCMNILTFLSMVAQGSQRAMMPVLGVLYGEKDYQGVRMLFRYVMKYAFAMAGALLLFLFAFPQLVLKIFNLAPELVMSGQTDIRLFTVSLIGVLISFMMMYYYTTINQTGAATLISVVEGILVVVPAAWLLVRTMGTRGVWFAFILAEAVTLTLLYVYTRYKHRRDPERYADLYMIPKTMRELLFDVSVKATRESAAGLSEGAIDALKENGITGDIAMKAGIALEEITLNLGTRQPGKKPDLDVRIIKNGEHITISLRDNGLPFNPMEYSPEDREAYLTDGVLLFKALARDIRYSRVLSLNQTIIDI